MKTKIYAITEPKGDIRYIGKTKGSLDFRLANHLSEARRGVKNYRCYWIRLMLNKGLLPSIVLIGEVEGNGSNEERAWIAYGRKMGWRLTNLTDGGEGILGHIKSKKTLRKMRIAALQRKPISEETRKKLVLSHLNYKMPEEQKRKIGLASSKYMNKEEVKEKLRQRMMGNKLTLGYHHTDETCQKIRLASTGRHLSEDAKQKDRIAHLGQRRTSKMRHNMVLAWEKRKLKYGDCGKG